jgi:hypothetical protein
LLRGGLELGFSWWSRFGLNSKRGGGLQLGHSV